MPDFAGGTGTVEDPYLIETEDQLNNIRDYSGYHFRLIDDIDLVSDWTPISSWAGIFDGNFHKITNFNCTNLSGHAGMIISNASGSTVFKNLMLFGGSTGIVTTSADYCGYILVVQRNNLDSEVYIQNCLIVGKYTPGGDRGAGVVGITYNENIHLNNVVAICTRVNNGRGNGLFYEYQGSADCAGSYYNETLCGASFSSGGEVPLTTTEFQDFANCPLLDRDIWEHNGTYPVLKSRPAFDIADWNTGKVAPFNSNFTIDSIPYFDNVILALPLSNGVVGGSYVKDYSKDGRIVTSRFSSPEYSTTQVKFGNSSMYFDGGSSYLAIDSVCADLVGEETYTIEGWFYHNNTNLEALFAFNTSTGSDREVLFEDRYIGGSGTTYFDTDLPGNEWAHVAMVRTATTLKVFMNGVIIVNIPVTTTSPIIATDLFSIGQQFNGGLDRSNEFDGYIQDFVITKGVAKYSDNFTPPTESLIPLTELLWKEFPVVIYGPEHLDVDPYFDDVILALPFDGTDGSTTFTDISEAPKTLTAVGNAQIDTDQSKFGGASLKLDGSGDYVSMTDPVFSNLGNTYTIEAWIRPTDAITLTGVFFLGSSSSNTNRLQLNMQSGGLYTYEDTSGNAGVGVNGGIGIIQPNEWCHIALVRDGNTTNRLFINGVKVAESVPTRNTQSTYSNFYVGIARNSSTLKYFPGHIDDFRITRGIAKYADDFVPIEYPSYAVPADPEDINLGKSLSALFAEFDLTDPYWSDVVLALPFDGADGSTTIIDNSPITKTVTVNGNAQLKTAESKFGGSSVYFDGDDSLSLVASSDWVFGTDDFTVELWLYVIEMPTGYYHAPLGTWAAGSTGWCFFIKPDGSIYWQANDGNLSLSSAGLIVSGKWYHLAYSRVSGVGYLFVDGVLIASEADTKDITSNTTLYIGRNNNTTDYMHGYIDDLKITKGVGRYTEDFNIPQIPVTTENRVSDPTELAKKIAIREGTSNYQYPIRAVENSWINQDTIIFYAAIPFLSDSQVYNLFYDINADDNPNVTLISSVPTPPTDPDYLAFYQDGLDNILWDFIVELDLLYSWLNIDYSSFPIEPRKIFFDEIYSHLFPFQNYKDLIYGIKLGMFFNAYYGNAPVVRAFINEYYGDTQVLQRYYDFKYGDSKAVISYEEFLYNISVSYESFVDLIYFIAGETRQRFIDIEYSISDLNKNKAWKDFIYAINANSVIEDSDLIITVDGVRIYPSHVNFEFNRDSYKAFAEIHLADQESYLLCIENQSVLRIQDGIDDLYFEIEVPREMANLGETTYVIPAESKSRILERSARITREFGAGLASEIAISLAAEYGIILSWHVDDWFIPGGKLYANDETPIEVIRKLSGAIGAKLQPTADGNIVVVKNMEYDTTAWDTSTPTYYLTDQANFFSTTEDVQERDGYNKYNISNYGISDKIAYIDEEAVTATSKILKGYKIPFTGKELGLYHSGGSWVAVEKYGAVEELITELVEIIKGSGTVDKPIYSLVDYEYAKTILGAITYNEDGTISTEVAGQSLVTITYKTKYWSWKVTDPNIEDVQFWVEEV